MALITKSITQVVNDILARFLASQDQVTDVSPGSVLRTLVEAISFEIGTSPSGFLGLDLYDQLINIYSGGFIDLASGIQLEYVVAILGVSRTGSVPSSTTITFKRNTPAVSDITIPSSSVVATASDAETNAVQFETTQAGILPTIFLNERHSFSVSATPVASDFIYDFDQQHVHSIVEITGVYGGLNVTFTSGVDYVLQESSNGTSEMRWLTEQATPLIRNPDNGTDFFVDYVPLSIDIPAIATRGGSQTNVGALSITTRVSVPLGIESVTNYVTASGGTNQESDASLRKRSLNQLAVLAKSTVAALKFSILAVDGVIDVQIDDLPVTDVFEELQVYNTGDAFTSLNESPIDSVSLFEAQKSETQVYTTGSDNALTTTPVTEIISVRTDEATPTYFVDGVDYNLLNDEVMWIGGSTPINGQQIVITYYAQLTEDTDFEIYYNKKNIKWLTGIQPDDNTNVRITYKYTAVGVATALILANIVPISPTLRAEIESKIESTRAAGIQVNITEPSIQTIDVGMTLYLSVEAPANATDRVETNVTEYINALSLGEDVIHSELIYQAQRVTGVFDVVVTDPSANIAIPIDRIARAGIISIAVL